MSQDFGYVMYSAFGSFYIPSCIMVFVYIKIYYAARERARRNIAKPKFSKRISRRFTKKTKNQNSTNHINRDNPSSSGSDPDPSVPPPGVTISRCRPIQFGGSLN